MECDDTEPDQRRNHPPVRGLLPPRASIRFSARPRAATKVRTVSWIFAWRPPALSPQSCFAMARLTACVAARVLPQRTCLLASRRFRYARAARRQHFEGVFRRKANMPAKPKPTSMPMAGSGVSVISRLLGNDRVVLKGTFPPPDGCMFQKT